MGSLPLLDATDQSRLRDVPPQSPVDHHVIKKRCERVASSPNKGELFSTRSRTCITTGTGGDCVWRLFILGRRRQARFGLDALTGLIPPPSPSIDGESVFPFGTFGWRSRARLKKKTVIGY